MSILSRKKTSLNMLTDTPGKALFFFAVPIILGNLFQQFYNMVDGIVVARFVGEEALAAVGTTYSLANVFIAVATGAGIGSSVVISQFWEPTDRCHEKSHYNHTDQLPCSLCCYGRYRSSFLR